MNAVLIGNLLSFSNLNLSLEFKQLYLSPFKSTLNSARGSILTPVPAILLRSAPGFHLNSSSPTAANPLVAS